MLCTLTQSIKGEPMTAFRDDTTKTHKLARLTAELHAQAVRLATADDDTEPSARRNVEDLAEQIAELVRL
jgi:hypothetical protein